MVSLAVIGSKDGAGWVINYFNGHLALLGDFNIFFENFFSGTPCSGSRERASLLLQACAPLGEGVHGRLSTRPARDWRRLARAPTTRARPKVMEQNVT